MKYGVYSMRDKHVGFLEPRLDVNDDSAVRNFAITINNSPSESLIGFAPGDFDLYKFGEFDSVKGFYDLLPVPEFIICGSSLVGDGYAREM